MGVEDALKGDKRGLKGDGEDTGGYYCFTVPCQIEVFLYILFRW